jgi:hypothetical protein
VVIVSLGKETEAEDGNRWCDVDVILVGLFEVVNSTGSLGTSSVKKVSGSVKTENGLGQGGFSVAGNLMEVTFNRRQINGNHKEEYIQLTVADPKLLSEQK